MASLTVVACSSDAAFVATAAADAGLTLGDCRCIGHLWTRHGGSFEFTAQESEVCKNGGMS
eukprot:scaffold14728_cov100-Skeletonema_dohrnii-CCMP3373.AAC.2